MEAIISEKRSVQGINVGERGKRIEKCHNEGPDGLILTSICSYDSNNRRFS